MKILKWVGIIILSLIIIGFIAYLIVDEPLPEGEKGPQAEELADKMLLSINDSAWEATAVVTWDFPGGHQFAWDKNRHLVQVKYDEKEVLIDLNTISGQAHIGGEKVTDATKNGELVQKAYAFWANDSFWLNPISKIRDAGTERFYVESDDPNYEYLLVRYTSGGVTPGDSYLWKVNKKSEVPESVEMWVNIIPVGGVEFSWQDWLKTETGAMIAQKHKGLITVNIDNIHTYPTYEGFDSEDIFSTIE